MNTYTFENVFTFKNLLDAYWKCTKGVKWKSSVQSYMIKAPYKLYILYEKLKTGTYRQRPFYTFSKNERGKIREIMACTFEDRIVQKCLCENFLIPAVSKSFIYDNSASQKGRGVHFALKRCKTHFFNALKLWGQDGYILQFDFHHYFASIDHDIVRQKIKEYTKDEKLQKLISHLIDCFGDIGIGLGSQMSQTIALLFPNDLDHTMKEKLHCRGYGRYMDDGYAFFKTKAECENALKIIREWCAKNKMPLNENKTIITKLNRGFVFLKKYFRVGRNGEIVVSLYKKNITKMRRKLLSLKRKLDIITLVNCYINSYKKFNAYYQLKRLRRIL